MSRPATEPNPLLAGLLCRCPRCGRGRLFAGFLRLAPRCEACGLDLAFADSGDGPAVFVIFAVAPVVVVLWIVTDMLFHPPGLVHLALWIPTTLVLCLALLRPFKATLIALQHRHDAQEGRLDA